jgi:hypothetical protein
MSVTSPTTTDTTGADLTSTTHDNKNGKADVPSCHIRDSDDNEY